MHIIVNVKDVLPMTPEERKALAERVARILQECAERRAREIEFDAWLRRAAAFETARKWDEEDGDLTLAV